MFFSKNPRYKPNAISSLIAKIAVAEVLRLSIFLAAR